MAGGKSGFGLNFGSAPPVRRRILTRAFQLFLIPPILILLALALSYQMEGWARTALLLLLAAGSVAIARLWWTNNVWSVWLAIVMILATAAVWWSTIKPSNDRPWQTDVRYGVTADLNGNIATVHNIRNFDWRTTSDYTEDWQTRQYNLDQLSSVDLFTSVWGSPAIAHILVSFGFEDGQHIVFSAETRKAEGQVYSTLGGFFRLYTLVLIAADERDIIRLRTDVRDDPKETVRIFPVHLNADRRRELLLEYLALGNSLDAQPQFYNTLTTNCTTVVWKLARKINPGLPLTWRVLLSGYFPEYLYDHGAIRTDVPFAQVMQEAIVPPQGPAGPDSAAFSRRLREHEPK